MRIAMMNGVSRMCVTILVIGGIASSRAAPVMAQTPASWTADAQVFRVGDAISVLLDEYTLASANRDVSAEQQRSRSFGVAGSANGTELGRASVDTENAGSSRDRGRSTRHDRLTAEMTVRVEEIAPDGMLKVSGTKHLTIDEHEQELTLTGWVRPADVPAHNVMESWRIADATIEYTSSGRLGKPRQGLISRVLGWIWP